MAAFVAGRKSGLLSRLGALGKLSLRPALVVALLVGAWWTKTWLTSILPYAGKADLGSIARHI